VLSSISVFQQHLFMRMRVQHTIFAFMVEGYNRYLNLVNVHLGINFPIPWREGIKGEGICRV